MTKVFIDRALIEQAVEFVRVHGMWAKAGSHVYQLAKELRAALAEPAVEHRNHVGNSKFESWFSEYDASGKGDKQRARDAYAAGMGDPVNLPSPQPPAEHGCKFPMCQTEEYPQMLEAQVARELIGVPLLSDEEIDDVWMIAREANEFPTVFARAIEQLVRRKAGL